MLKKKLDDAYIKYCKNGYCILKGDDFLSKNFFSEVYEKVDNNKFFISEINSTTNNDAIFKDKVFLQPLLEDKFIRLIEKFCRGKAELQHSKFFNKYYKKNDNKQIVDWHQDYPFFPHTNENILAVSIRLDNEDYTNGCLRIVKNSHKEIINHFDEKGNFLYKIPKEEINFDESVVENIECQERDIIIHHPFLIHSSQSIISYGKKRRVIYYQVRNINNFQIGGVIWKCTGYPISNLNKDFKQYNFQHNSINQKSCIRRLVDLYSSLCPDSSDSRFKITKN